MPIELADYTKPIRDRLKRGKFCCVYVAAIDTPALSRIGYAEDLTAAIARLERTSPTPVTVDSALWVPDKGIAMVMASAVHCDLAALRKSGGWLSTSAERVTMALQIASVRIYPGATMIWHDRLLEQFCRLSAAKSG